eukprot:CAMPEP_0114688364 /NCGR_PEP_ID=MMETSP0191-20121206/63391_1 /TAXON_ID=126664 /ORGANISM="Sorites sp." /LENGTH=40 /DNA_ID= /DNA_START= /DNA_END= /DNA_ORIENTATION=
MKFVLLGPVAKILRRKVAKRGANEATGATDFSSICPKDGA